jgi:protein-disulfide isomerase
MHPNAPFAHRASLAAGDQGRFWEMHDVLFRNQSKATKPGVLEFAGQLGLDMARFQADLESNRFDARLQRDKEEGDRLGVDGTPTFFINGVRLVGARPASDFGQIIDRQLAAATAATPAYRDAVASRTLGAADAKVTIVWFGDLRNPLNAEASQLMRQIATAYEQSVRIVFKNSPLRNRSESVLMYDAALAAGAQGRFWEMEDLLSGDQSINSLTALTGLARELGLDVSRFESNVSDRTFRTVSTSDLEDGERLGVHGTPTFFINDERVDGLVTFDELNTVVERHLRGSGAAQPLDR